jgi:hypothetical protein
MSVGATTEDVKDDLGRRLSLSGVTGTSAWTLNFSRDVTCMMKPRSARDALRQPHKLSLFFTVLSFYILARAPHYGPAIDPRNGSDHRGTTAASTLDINKTQCIQLPSMWYQHRS